MPYFPAGSENRFVTDPAKLRWLHLTDAQLRPWLTAAPANVRPLVACGRISESKAIGEPRNADGSPNYDYLDCGEWWNATDANGMGRGWVRNERFGTGQVIAGTRRKAKV